MRPGIEPAGFKRLERAPRVAWRRVGAESAQQSRGGFRITHGAEQRLDTGCAERWEEVAQVHFQNHALAGMRTRKCLNGVAFQEAMHGRVRRDPFEYSGKDPALQLLEP